MAVEVAQQTYVMLPLKRIISRLPVRRLSASGVARIQKSMERSGFLENYPLIVTPLEDGDYQLVDGNHRYEAAYNQGIESVPCVVREQLTEGERYRLAFQSNNAAEAVVASTLVTYAEFIWMRSDKGATLDEIAEILEWGIDKVKKYSALKQIHPDVWSVIVPTFESIGTSGEGEDGTIKVPLGTFSEFLLRDILPLSRDQQLELVQALAHPNEKKRISKGKFKTLAENYKARNEMKDYALAKLGNLGESYTDQLKEAIYSGAYDTDWSNAEHPKLHKLITALRDEWERKNSIHPIHGNFYTEVKNVGDGSIDLIVTDPPYNVASAREFVMAGRSNISQDFGEWDKYEHQKFIELFDTWACEWYRILKDDASGYVFTSDIYLSHLREALIRAGFDVQATIVWHKTNPAPQFIKTTFQSSVEYILFFTKGKEYTFHWLGDGGEMHNFLQSSLCAGKERLVDAKGETLHPTQKPVQLLTHLLQVSSNRGDMVFDGFAGVGSTGKAAKDLGRKFIGIEQDETFYKAMERRLADD